jgi:hypothetical protein
VSTSDEACGSNVGVLLRILEDLAIRAGKTFDLVPIST